MSVYFITSELWSGLVGYWSSVFIRRIFYFYLDVCPFITQLLWLVGMLVFRKRFNHTSWMAVVTPIDRPKSVRNRCVIKVLVVVMLSFVILIFRWYQAFVIRLSHFLLRFSVIVIAQPLREVRRLVR